MWKRRRFIAAINHGENGMLKIKFITLINVVKLREITLPLLKKLASLMHNISSVAGFNIVHILKTL